MPPAMEPEESKSPVLPAGMMVRRESLQRLGSSLHDLLGDQLFCDVTLVCPDGKLHAHASMLLASCEYFSDKSEDVKSGEVHISNLQRWIMELVLEFIYSGQVELNPLNILSVFRASIQLQFKPLQAYCRNEFKKHLSMRNIVEAYQDERSFGMQFQDFVLNHIEKNFKEVMKSDEFLDNARYPLMKQILKSDNLVVDNEDTVFQFLADWWKRNTFQRMNYACKLKRYIRFPFLRVKTVTRLAELFGSHPRIKELGPVECWNTSSSMFRRRQYQEIHCHFAWQVSNEAGRTLFITCSNLGDEPVSYLSHQAPNVPKICGIAVSGRKLYSKSVIAPKAILEYNLEDENLFQTFTMRINPHTQGGIEPTIRPRKICQFKTDYNGELIVLWADHAGYAIYKLEIDGTYRDLAWSGSLASTFLPHGNMAIIADSEPYLINTQTGQTEPLIRSCSSEAYIDDLICGSSLIIEHTLYLYYLTVERQGKNFVMIVDLTTREWTHSIRDGIYLYNKWDAHLVEIEGRAYVITRTAEEDSESDTLVRRVEEDTESLIEIQNIPFEAARFLGVVPRDLLKPCAHETWLSAFTRTVKNPDTTQARYKLEILRKIMR